MVTELDIFIPLRQGTKPKQEKNTEKEKNKLLQSGEQIRFIFMYPPFLDILLLTKLNSAVHKN